jgi:hypothetical protein
MSKKVDLQELGATGLRRSGGTVYEEFLVNLRGQRGFRIYREMADNDPVIGSIIYAIEKVVTRLDWRVDPYRDNTQDGEPDEKDIEVANFIEDCMYDMSESWDSTLSNILSMLVFGFSYHEIVYKIRKGPEEKDPTKRSKFTDGKIGWRKIPVRAQETLFQWMLDEDGGIQGMWQVDPSSGGTHIIPIEKALLFRVSTQKNNPEGRSLLRNAYRPWFFKRRIEEIEAVGIERDLAGLPVAFVPPEYLSSAATPEQASVLQTVEDIVTRIKRNEQEGVVFPTLYDDAGHKMFDLQLLSSGGSRQFDTDKIVQRYDQRIAMSVLSDFILLGHDRVGSYSLGASKIDLWSMSVDALARSIAEVFNQHAIPRLLRLNGMDTTRLPELTYGDVAQVDLTEISQFVSQLAAAGIIVSDSKLEAHLRLIAGLPPAEETPEGMEVPNMMPQQEGEQMSGAPTTDEPTAAEREGDELLASQPPYEGDDD